MKNDISTITQLLVKEGMDENTAATVAQQIRALADENAEVKQKVIHLEEKVESQAQDHLTTGLLLIIAGAVINKLLK